MAIRERPPAVTFRSFGEYLFRNFARLKRYYGRRFLYGINATADATMEGIQTAMACRFVAVAPEDALPYLGRDSGLVRGPSESSASWRQRIRRRWTAWEWAGTSTSLEDQLEAYGFAVDQPSVLALTSWTPSAAPDAVCTIDPNYTDPDGGTNAIQLTDGVDGSALEHYIWTAPLRITAGASLTFRIKARPYGVDFMKMQIDDGMYAWIDLDNKEIVGGAGLDGAHLTDIGGDWSEVMITGIPASSSPSFRILMSTSQADTYQATGAYEGIQLYEPRIEHARVQVIDNEDWDFDYPPAFSQANWSRFGIVVPEGLHSWTSVIPADDQRAITQILNSFRPAHCVCHSVTAVVSGRLAGWPFDGATSAELNAIGFTSDQNASLQFTPTP